MHKYLTILLFLSSFAAKSQTVLIPYREGKLWGVCDTLGNIVVKPAYDRVEIIDKFAPGYFRTLKKGRYGVINSKEEIIKPVFNNINCWWNSYFEADSSNSKHFFNLNGDPLFPGNYTSMWAQTSIEGKPKDPKNSRSQKPLFLFFIGFDTNYRTGLFCYNIEKPEDSKLLSEGKKNYEIDIDVRHINYYSSVFGVAGKYFLVSYNFKKKKLIVLKFKTEKELKKAEQKIRDERRKEIKDQLQKPESVQETKTKIYTPPKVRIRSVYKLVNGELFLESSYENQQSLTYHTTLKKVDFNSKDYTISIKLGYASKIKEDTSFSYLKYVLYKKNYKHGFIWADQIIPNIYDSLYFIQCDSFKYFIYGVRDSTGKMKLGTMKPDGTVVIAPEYNEISYKIYSYYDYINVPSSYQWIVKKGAKFGIITPKNKILLDFKYDTIFKANNLIHLKKDGLYGVYYSSYSDEHFTEPIVLVEPFVPYKILKIVYLPRTEDITKNHIQLLELADKDGRIMGYTNTKGFKYFKD